MKSDEIQIKSLAEISTDVSYGYTASSEEENIGPKFLRITDIQGGVVNWDDVPYCKIDDEDFEKYRLFQNDIVVARTGNSTGENYIVKDSVSAVFASYLIRFKIDPEIVEPKYVWYQMRSKSWWNFISGAKTGSAQSGANAKVLGTFPVEIPERNIQKKVVSILETLDQKIHLNQQTNETLEAMAQAIFKSWFVDFDPVRAKIEAKSAGRDPNRAAMAAIARISLEQDWDQIEATLDQKLARMSETQQQQLTRTAQLFPDELVESEILEVPKGWDYGNLGDICSVQGGYAFKSKLFKEEGYPVVKIKNINEDYTVDLKNGQFLSADDTIDKETYELDDGDYVLAMTGATVGKTGIIVSNSEKVMLNQRVAKFESDKFNGNINWFIHSAFLATNLKDQVVNIARGSAQPNISATGIESAEIIIPSEDLIEKFINIADPLFKNWIDNYKQNETLSSLRDMLLPKLISGEVGV